MRAFWRASEVKLSTGVELFPGSRHDSAPCILSKGSRERVGHSGHKITSGSIILTRRARQGDQEATQTYMVTLSGPPGQYAWAVFYDPLS
jgi:hypothetical protein